MSERGVFAIDRGLFDHPFFKNEPFTEREAWSWMIGECAYEDTRVRVNRVVYDVRRGQFVHAMRFMAQRWKWSEARVRRFLERLKSERMIDALASSEATIITVCKYDVYQFRRRTGDEQSDEPATNRRRREEELEETNKLGGGDSARAREPLVSPEALDFADQLAVIAGHDPKFLPPRWISDGPAYRVQMMLNAGWKTDVMRQQALAMMRAKRDGPPGTIRYFEPGFARAHAPQLPLPSAKLIRENGNEPASKIPDFPASDYRAHKDRQRREFAEFRAFATNAAANQRGGGGS